VVSTVLSWDEQNDPDIVGLLAASVALSTSDIPWLGPVAAVRIGRIDGNFVLNPTYEEKEKSEIDLVFSGMMKNGEFLVNMMEGGFDEVEESIVLEALDFSEKYLKKIIEFQQEVSKKTGKEKVVLKESELDLDLEKEIQGFLGDRLEKALFQKEKNKRVEKIGDIKEEAVGFVEEKYPGQGKTKYAKRFFDKEIGRLIHENIIEHGKRADGRKLEEIRPISCEAGLLPRTHGSGLFCRGQTKSLSILTLGAPGDQQILEGMEITGKKRFMHHYNFPPYSSGEIKPMRGPGRREIGHGMLAEKALLPLIPGFEEFPYTIRIVSEILSSNGSTSMASVSSSSLALMDAGVPIKRPATGISIGLARGEKTGDYKLMTDIQGPEDHHGDMDFKVAGTRQGMTALQMDVKIDGINKKIMKEALERAKNARLEILEHIEKVLSAPRPELSPYAPRILTMKINPEKIREVIGPGGKMINEIVNKTGATIDIEQDGSVFITAGKEEAAQKAFDWIKNITREVQVGEVFEGKVCRILNFGAFVEILPGQDGMVHISKLGKDHVRRVEDVVKIGDIVSVKVISIDEQGRINLSLLENNRNK
jgi:polyribonucleotide nucleotidyltransferase